MRFRRVSGLAAIVFASLLWMSCGQVFRPVVIPISTTPPNTSNFHAVFAVSTNVGPNYGTTFQIDVAGDSNIGQANTGIIPTHAGILPNNSRVFVASAGTLFPGQGDNVTAFFPANDSTVISGLGTVTSFTLPYESAGQSANITGISEAGSLVTVTLSAALPNAKTNASIAISGVGVTGYDGTFPINTVAGNVITYVNSTTGLGSSSGGVANVPVICPYLPDYVTTSQNTAVYVASYGTEGTANCNLPNTDSVALLSPTTNAITNIAYLPPGAHPVAMVETPQALNLYVVNQGNNTVTDLSPIDLSTITPAINVGTTPVWVVSRVDGQRIYVLTQGSGTLVPIDTATDTVLTSQTNLSVGAGANYIYYDPILSRLYVTNPTTGMVYVFSTTGGVDASGTPNDTPTLLATISMTAGTNPPCPNGCAPMGVAAIPDGSRFYVASYASFANCPDPNVGTASACIVPMMTVFDSASFAVEQVSSTLLAPSPSLSLLTYPQFAATQYAVPVAAACVATGSYVPGATRFRMFTTASSDGSHVYASICDAGTIADVVTVSTSVNSTGGNNTGDVLESDIAAPFSAAGVYSNGVPIPQSPIFLLTGQ
ncbi:MAG TPA: hypothetical protein VMX38_19590 [Verrucomicrobiae bacterium]|jgi:hypothetical protein|nr:hypothetical protein [Verrucomicrobiae bacterium]